MKFLGMQAQHVIKGQRDLILMQPGVEQSGVLESDVEAALLGGKNALSAGIVAAVMAEFAATILMSLESWVLHASLMGPLTLPPPFDKPVPHEDVRMQLLRSTYK